MRLDPVRLHHVDFAAIDVTPRTTWTFARLWDSEGIAAEVEVTAGEATDEVVSRVSRAVAVLSDALIAEESDIPIMLDVEGHSLRTNLADATAISALRTAIVLLQALKSGVSLCEVLGGQAPSSIPLYANINRGLFTTGRTPAEFAEAASRAVSEGFRSVKCDPFDEVTPGRSGAEAVRLARTGVERIAAVREAVGPEVALMVDCHSRFDVESAVVVAGEMDKLGVSWFEEPVDPAKDAAGLTEIASRIPMLLAGGEHGYGEEFFAGLTEHAGVKVIMPDVKFCGGAASAVRAGKAAVTAGGGVSLHCPSGPLSLLTSGHVTAAIAGALPLEHAVHEADWRASLLVPAESVKDGRLPPQRRPRSRRGARLGAAAVDGAGLAVVLSPRLATLSRAITARHRW